VTDRLLEAEHLKPEDIKNISVPVIPERFQLLMQGQLSAATLPDPMAKSAMAAGAVLVIDDAKYPQFAVSVLSFGIQSLGRRPVEVRNFLKAWDQAVADIDARPENYRDLLLKKIRVPKNIQDTFKIPPYPRKTVPDGEQWADVMAWMVSKKLLKHPLPYQPSVTSAFLPE
jgi:NitT/TauT family transport system substrate-binding protein